MCSMHRRSDQASSIMPTSGIYGGKTTFASTLSLHVYLSLSSSRPVLSFTPSRTFIFVSLSLSLSLSLFYSLCSCLFLHHLSFSLSLSLTRSRGTQVSSSSFFSVPLPAFYGMHRSLTTPTKTKSAKSALYPPRQMAKHRWSLCLFNWPMCWLIMFQSIIIRNR